ncbi:MAG: thioredoxin-dependent thiol peroxidase [Saprospiraceae bacterium]|nr:thioredoxin-dependent thiol peroxidase [Saprospiraceae bacterium]
MTQLKSGDKAPNFKSTDEQGNLVSLADFKDKKLVLYFYPADSTPTCTVEACNLRDNFEVLRKAGYHVLGVSPDSAKKHQSFIKKHSLPFPLLMDEDHAIIKAYDVWGPKVTFGKAYDGLMRTTFLINEKGVIERVIDKVESKRHAEQILAG